jgi:hypothetical protein
MRNHGMDGLSIAMIVVQSSPLTTATGCGYRPLDVEFRVKGWPAVYQNSRGNIVEYFDNSYKLGHRNRLEFV